MTLISVPLTSVRTSRPIKRTGRNRCDTRRGPPDTNNREAVLNSYGPARVPLGPTKLSRPTSFACPVAVASTTRPRRHRNMPRRKDEKELRTPLRARGNCCRPFLSSRTHSAIGKRRGGYQKASVTVENHGRMVGSVR